MKERLRFFFRLNPLFCLWFRLNRSESFVIIFVCPQLACPFFLLWETFFVSFLFCRLVFFYFIWLKLSILWLNNFTRKIFILRSKNLIGLLFDTNKGHKTSWWNLGHTSFIFLFLPNFGFKNLLRWIKRAEAK